MTPNENKPQTLDHYGRWLLAWIQAADRPVPSRRSLQTLDRKLVSAVAARVEVFETGNNDNLDLPIGGTAEEMAIAAELRPLLDKLTELHVTDRQMSSSEQDLLACRAWGDRPSLAALRDLGQDLTELTAAGLSPWQDLGFTPTAYLPSELRVISEAANLTVDQVYQL